MDSLLAGVLAEKSEHQEIIEAYNEEDTSRSITKYVDKKPVWEDEDDNTAVVNITGANRLKKLRTAADEAVIPASEYAARLRAQHKKLNPGTTWAELPWQRKKRKIRGGGDDFGLALGLENEDEDEEEELSYEGEGDVGALLENNELAVKSKGRLPQGLIEVTRMKDANVVEPSDAVIQSVEFHRNAQLLLTAGFDKKIRFFQVCLLLSLAFATECY